MLRPNKWLSLTNPKPIIEVETSAGNIETQIASDNRLRRLGLHHNTTRGSLSENPSALHLHVWLES